MQVNITQFPDHIQQKKDWIDKARDLYKMQEARKATEKQEKQLKAELVSLSSRESSIGGGFLFTKVVRAGSVLYKQIPEVIEILKTINQDNYRGKTVESWKLERK